MSGEFLKRAVYVLTLSAIAFGSSEDKISVDQIVQRHVQALGGRNTIGTVRTTITRAEYREGALVIPDAHIAKMRPYYKTICDPRGKLGDVPALDREALTTHPKRCRSDMTMTEIMTRILTRQPLQGRL
jgi:hypothetical protein